MNSMEIHFWQAFFAPKWVGDPRYIHRKGFDEKEEEELWSKLTVCSLQIICYGSF